MELSLTKIVIAILFILTIILVIPNIFNIYQKTKTGINTSSQLQDSELCRLTGKFCDDINLFLEFLQTNALNDDFSSSDEKVEDTSISDYVLQDLVIHSENLKDLDIRYTPYWVTSSGETGHSIKLITGLATCALDTGNTISYGNFGLNSNAKAVNFYQNYAECLGLKYDKNMNMQELKNFLSNKNNIDEWKKVAKNNPENLIRAQVDWYNKEIINVAINTLKKNNFPDKIANDPRLISYLCDCIIQEGASSMQKLVQTHVPYNGKDSATAYMKKLKDKQISDEYLQSKFTRYLKENPNNIKGLKNRVNKRYELSMQAQFLKIKVPPIECVNTSNN